MNLKNSTKLLFLFIALIVVTSCSPQLNKSTAVLPCNEDWLLLIEQQINTGDKQGHGPDVGSLEWRHTVERRLSLRDETDIQATNSTAWCEYIDKHIIQSSN
jgi:hypothetical protein